MDLANNAYTVIFWVIVLGVVLIGGSYVIGSPVIFGYTETDSMDPSISPGDGYVALPQTFVGGVNEGDIIVYESTSISEEELTVHRVVERTPEGYITKGDNNPVTDQDEGEPPVSDTRVRGVVPTIGGNAISSSIIGSVFQSLDSISTSVGEWIMDRGIVLTQTATVVLVTGVVLVFVAYFIPEANNRGKRSTGKGHTFSTWVVFGFIIMAFALPLITGMLIPTETNDLRILVTENTHDDDRLMVASGETAEIEFAVEKEPVPKIIIFDSPSDSVSFDPQSVIVTPSSEEQVVTATIDAPDETGWYDRPRVENHYYLTLPPGVILWLHSIHPIIALISVVSVILVPVTAIGLLFFAGGDIYLREVNR